MASKISLSIAHHATNKHNMHCEMLVRRSDPAIISNKKWTQYYQFWFSILNICHFPFSIFFAERSIARRWISLVIEHSIDYFIIIFLWLCADANSIWHVGQTFWCVGLPRLGHVAQFSICILGTGSCPSRWRLLAVHRSFHSRFGRRSDCAMHACHVGQMDSTQWTISHGRRCLCR